MNTFFTLASTFNIDYIFNHNLKKIFVLLKCFLHIAFSILGLLKKQNFFWYFFFITIVQIAHYYYDNGKMLKIYYFDPLYLLSTPFLSNLIGPIKVIFIQIIKFLYGLYLYARIQMENHFYCYQDKPSSQWYHGVCPPYNTNKNTIRTSYPICSQENCLTKPNIRPLVYHIVSYVVILIIIGFLFSLFEIRKILKNEQKS